jgi:hypothetical protein
MKRQYFAVVHPHQNGGRSGATVASSQPCLLDVRTAAKTQPWHPPFCRRRTTTALLMVLLFVGSAAALEPPKPPPLWRHSWKEQHEQQKLTSGEFVAGTDGRPDALKLVQTEPEPKQFPLLEFTPPTIGTTIYFVIGKVRYEGVEGEGYLEMWSHFPNGGMFFTKTLATAGGPLGVIRGSSDWREFTLPFNKGEQPSPTKLVINLVLPGRGIVEVSDLRLEAPADDVINFKNTAAAWVWWDARTSGLVGGIGGSALGIFLGCVIAPLIGSGRARIFVYMSLGAVGGCGLIGFVAGLSALAVGQPYHVFYPLLLLGGMSVLFGFGGIALALQRYRQHDLRRMSALDAG